MLLRYLIFVVPIFLGAVGLFVLFGERAPSGEEARVAQVLSAMEKAASSREVRKVMAHVSEHYQGEAGTRKELEAWLKVLMLRAGNAEAAIIRQQIEVEGVAATADLSVVLSGRGHSGRQELGGYRIQLGLEREQGDWRVVTASWRPAGTRELLMK